MRMQSSEANCGSTSLHNALNAIGVTLSLEACERVCNTTATSGTNVYGIIDAIVTIRGDSKPVVLNKESPNNLFILSHMLTIGRPAVLCIDDNDHYVAAIGLLGRRVIIADSASNE